MGIAFICFKYFFHFWFFKILSKDRSVNPGSLKYIRLICRTEACGEVLAVFERRAMTSTETEQLARERDSVNSVSRSVTILYRTKTLHKQAWSTFGKAFALCVQPCVHLHAYASTHTNVWHRKHVTDSKQKEYRR